MNLEEDMFNPEAVGFTRIVGQTSSPVGPPAGAKILIDETDAMGVATVMIYKETPDVDPVIPLKYVPGSGLVLDDFGRKSILKGTHVCPSMNLVSINGCDCSILSLEEANMMILSTEGELTLQAIHSQVLLWPTEEGDCRNLVLSPLPEPGPQTGQPSEESNNAHSPINTPATEDTNNSQQQQQQPKKIKVVVQKSSKRSSVGLSVINETIGTTTIPVIERIDPQGLCANTALQAGMRIWTVNGLVCYTKDDTMAKLKRAKGTCYIEAQWIPELREDAASNKQARSTSTSPKRGVGRSITPKKWLPAFHRNRQSTKAELIPSEAGALS